MNEKQPAGDSSDRVVKIVVIGVAVVFLLGCASMIGLFVICASL